MKPLSFDGKAGEAYAIWEIKFKAYAQEKGFARVLHASHKAKLLTSKHDALVATVLADKAKLDALEKNGKAVRAMIGTFSKPNDMNKIMMEQRHDGTDWLSIKAYKIWQAMQLEYQPDNLTLEVDMERALMKIKLSKKQNLA